MAEITYKSGNKVGELQFKQRVNEVKSVMIETAATVDADDAIEIPFYKYGITTVLGVFGFKHTTDNQVIVTENPTTVVADEMLILTIPSGTDDDKRLALIVFE